MANTIDNEWETIPQDEWETIPLQGSAPKNINPALDATQGLISGLTEMPRAIDKVISPIANPIANAISYPFANKNESYEDYSKRNDEAYNKIREDYKPQTALGGAAKFVGSVIPTLAVAPTKIGGSALLGAGLGAMNSINRGDDPFEVALNTVGGGIGGGLGHGALKKVEELAQPVGKFLGEKFAGISPESYQNVLNKYKQGKNPFEGKFNEKEALRPVTEKINNAYNEAFKPKEYFNQQKQNIQENLQLNTQKENEALKNNLNAIKQQQEKVESGINKQYNQYANKISDTYNKTKQEYSTAVGEAKQSLSNDEPVNYIDINKIVDDISESKGAFAKEDAADMTSDVKRILQRRGIEDLSKTGEFKATANHMGVSSSELKQLLQENPDELALWGFNPDELKINRQDIHDAKAWIQQNTNYNGKYQASKQIGREIASSFNNILRENENYANFNDKFSKLADFIDENSWLKNTSTIASKLSNAENKSGELADTIGTIRKFQELLPEGSSIANDLEKLISQHQSVRSKLANKIEETKSNTQNAIENHKSSNLYTKEQLQDAINAQLEQTRLLPESVRNNPYSLENKNLNIQDAFSKLNESASPENQFMKELQDIEARSQFERIKPNPSASRFIGGTHAPLGVFDLISLSHGNLAVPALHALYASLHSPVLYKKALQGGQFASKNINPYVPSQAVNLYQQYLDSIKGQENER